MIQFSTKADAEDYIFDNYTWQTSSELEKHYKEYIFEDKGIYYVIPMYKGRKS